MESAMTTRAWFPLLAVLVLLSGCMSPQGDTAQDKRQAAQKMRSDTLAELYELEPQAREQIGKAVGYGVFSNVGIYLVVLSAGNGYGVVEDNETGAVHHMKMATGGLGLGLGVKDFRGVFVFTSREALDRFVESGWDASAQADAAAKSEEKGDAWAGAVDIADGIKLYQITKNGLALQATIQGTKYWKDDELS
jgi:lipid-binding SYLF domain-containing protein